ncbi:hypothetical protein IHE44_0006762 [Lamprotornis superbus]|uniref:Fe2OG dioxygenase domain-containing protein n=1 Tax=Lamprotornis superbus TaxID=245042 RepID=A0A835NHX6_9PASS|nr:hypothetical protein IHE44_0006762 [Lamprotornis superbus]
MSVALLGSVEEASILDLHSGALSLGKHFVNLYRYFGDKIQDIFTEEDFALYRDVRQRIQQRIAQVFGISSSAMYLTKPTFFSRMNSTGAKTTHDEYWHPHVDKVTYGSFDYTSLLYLSDYSKDFGGGRFVFMDADSNKTVEPRAGRVSFFTSGSENLHRVEKVQWGTRFAITISFSCNPEHGIADPLLGWGLSWEQGNPAEDRRKGQSSSCQVCDLQDLGKKEVKVFDGPAPLEWEGQGSINLSSLCWEETVKLVLTRILTAPTPDKEPLVSPSPTQAFKLKARWKKFRDAFAKDWQGVPYGDAHGKGRPWDGVCNYTQAESQTHLRALLTETCAEEWDRRQKCLLRSWFDAFF